MIRTTGVAALLAAVLISVAVVAQQPDTDTAQQPVFRTGVSLVRVDVTVSGRGDDTVSDLQASDFEVLEDDVPQAIESFQFIELAGERPVGDDTSLPIRSRDHGEAEASRDDVRVFALFLDDYHISDDLSTNLRLRTALEEWIQKAIKPTDIVVLMDPLMPITGIEYLRSKSEIIERIRKFKGREGVYLPVRSVLEEGQLRTRNPRRLRAEVTLSALQAIVTHLGALRGRRTSVIFVSQGPPLRFADAELESSLRDVLEAANKYNVTVNVLDPTGLTGSQARDVMWRLSSETGGRAIVNTNGLMAGLMDITRDASAYYLLGYAPTRTEADGKFHKIDVRLKRKGLRVLARRGYWAPTPQELAPSSGPAVPPGITRALNAFSQLVVGRRAATWIGYEPGDAGATRVRLAWEPRKIPGRNEDAVAALRLDATRQDVDLLKDERVTGSEARFEVAPGEMKLSILAESAAGDVIDRWTETLQVPAFSPAVPAVSTPWLVFARSPQEYRSIVSSPEDGAPTTRREFRRTDRVLARVRSYPADLQVAARLLSRSGSVLATLTMKAANGRSETELPLASLAIGEYILELSAASVQGTQFVAFRMVP
ncbi:MAG: VWA domain-containing protein [Vicinamibacterales bacterium]